MFDFHEKRKIRSFLYSKWVVLSILIVSAFFVSAVYDRYVVASEMKAKLEVKRAELKELEQRAQALEAKVQYLEGERGIEEELRNRFDVIKEGEQVVILLDERRKEGQVPVSLGGVAPTSEDTSEKSFFDFLKFWQ